MKTLNSGPMNRATTIFLTVAVMASLLAIPCTASFARDATLSKSNTATVQVVKKDDTKKERGFFEKILDGIKSVVNFFVADKPATTEQRKTAEPLQQSAVPLASPGAARATTTPVITVTQNPSVIIPQQVERKNDVLGFSKIEVKPEKNIPEVVDDRKPVIAPTEPAKQPSSLSAPAVAPSTTARTPSGQETAAPVASDTREPAAKIEQVAPKTVAIIQTPLARTPSESVTTTTATGTRTTATTTTATTTSSTRTTATTAPIEPTAITRVPPTQIIEATPNAPRETSTVTEPDARPTSHTETFDGQTIIGMTVAPVGTFAIVDTVDNITTNVRTFVVSLSGEGRVECPAITATTTTRQTATQTTTETTRAGVQETAPTAVIEAGETLSSGTLLQRAATTPQTLAAASAITDAASTIQQVQVISDVLKAEMLAQCPLERRAPVVSIGSGARFIVRTETRMAYVLDNSVRTFLTVKTAGVEIPPVEEGGTQQTVGIGGDVAPPEAPPPPPKPDLQPEPNSGGVEELDVVPTPGDCQATLKAIVFCAEKDCTQYYEFNAIFKVGNTVMNDFVTKIDASSFLLAPPTAAAEPAKGLSLSLNKADIQGPVTITVTAKKGDILLEKTVDSDVPNREDLIARCIQPEATTEGVIPKAYDETKADQGPTGYADISGGRGFGACSLIRR